MLNLKKSVAEAPNLVSMNAMKKYSVKPYNDQFDQLTECLLDMGELVGEAVSIAEQSLEARDEELRVKAKENDRTINRMDDEMERRITDLLSMQNPMAEDLRYVMSALKIAGALERAGDLAKNITKHMVRMDARFPHSTLKGLTQLAKISQEMLDQALVSFSERDPDIATKVWKRDEEADELCRQIFKSTGRAMPKDAEAAPELVEIMFAAKNFERIADHATDIAKTVHYVATGEKPKKSMLEDL